ncbi:MULTISPECIES: hypothetical protein [unclassified Aureispira]|uniref:hypothetical protein n=1 Tax=unclassified Aureispira TaxID=2649989 RepID=UPI000697B991|nr:MULTISPECIES: hypothetical protein [unclassified Aureispira]WMX16392.1 hypothetical protein QP953_08435 [Aureispira sp. CCB-E]
MEYLEHTVILIVFLAAIAYLVSIFRPSKASGCSKGCGNQCAVGNLEQAMHQFEQDWAEGKV